MSPGDADYNVLQRARINDFIVITEDRDFGELVFSAIYKAGGVLYIRWNQNQRSQLPQATLDCVKKYDSKLKKYFTVLEPGKIRQRLIPE